MSLNITSNVHGIHKQNKTVQEESSDTIEECKFKSSENTSCIKTPYNVVLNQLENDPGGRKLGARLKCGVLAGLAMYGAELRQSYRITQR